MSERFSLDAIGQVAMPVQDLERATEFYRNSLGLTYLFHAPGMSFFDCGGVRLMLAVPEGGAETAAPGSVLYFRVDDIGRAHAGLMEGGVEFVRAPHRVADLGSHELWMSFFNDGEQNVLALMSEVPKPSEAK